MEMETCLPHLSVCLSKDPWVQLLRSRSTPQDRYIPYNNMIPTS